MMPPKVYGSAVAFRKALEHRLQADAEKSRINLQRLRRMVAFNRFLARLCAGSTSPWVLKGGYAMELRLEHARATRDVDLAMKGKLPDSGKKQASHIQDMLSAASSGDLGDYFVFRVGSVQMELDGPLYGGARYPVQALVGNRLFVAFHVDVAIGDYIPSELEIGHERNFLSFAGINPASFPMIPREVQFAEKLHAYTMPRSVPNSRVRDLVDMVLLIKEGKMTHGKMVSAMKAVFTRRKTHTAPEALEPAPSRWEKIFSEMAEDCGLRMDMASGFKLLNKIYDDIHP
jgi:hypothetical protein